MDKSSSEEVRMEEKMNQDFQRMNAVLTYHKNKREGLSQVYPDHYNKKEKDSLQRYADNYELEKIGNDQEDPSQVERMKWPDKVEEDVTCTQVFRKWNAPNVKIASILAVKFRDLEFDKSNYDKDKAGKRKRPVVSGSFSEFFATPQFAKTVTRDEIQASSLKAAKAPMLVETLKGNDFLPCRLFRTSCTN
eukprot:gene10528-11634_t